MHLHIENSTFHIGTFLGARPQDYQYQRSFICWVLLYLLSKREGDHRGILLPQTVRVVSAINDCAFNDLHNDLHISHQLGVMPFVLSREVVIFFFVIRNDFTVLGTCIYKKVTTPKVITASITDYVELKLY